MGQVSSTAVAVIKAARGPAAHSMGQVHPVTGEAGSVYPLFLALLQKIGHIRQNKMIDFLQPSDCGYPCDCVAGQQHIIACVAAGAVKG